MNERGTSSGRELKLNVIANFCGRGWSSVIAYICIPLYLKYLGVESYGLVGVFASLQAMFAILDLGLGSTICREMARAAADARSDSSSRRLLRTLEIVYWGIGVAGGLAVVALAPFLANHWIRAAGISPARIHCVIVLMGLLFAIQWPLGLYHGAMNGLQRQVAFNFLTGLFMTLKSVGAVFIVSGVSPTIESFFLWQVVISGAQTCTFALTTWRYLPGEESVAPQWSLLLDIHRFATGISFISIALILLSQIDKIILSGILPLRDFAYYSLATSVAATLAIPVAPVSGAVFPRLTELVASGDLKAAIRLFHLSCQAISLIILPMAAALVLFPVQLLGLWLQNDSIVQEMSGVVRILSLGIAVNYCVMTPLDSLQMAHGWLTPAIVSRVVALIIIGPVMGYLASHQGPIGAAYAWLLVYGGFALFAPFFVFRRLMNTEMVDWYIRDIGVPAVGIASVSFLGFLFAPGNLSSMAGALYAIGVIFSAEIVAILFMPDIRTLLYRFVWPQALTGNPHSTPA